MGPAGETPAELILEVPPHRVALWKAGSGPPLILFHGAFISRILWKPCLPYLARHFTVYALDLAGHGETQTPESWHPDMVRFASDMLRALGCDTAVWAGSSFGGDILIRFAAVHPERVHRLVLVSPTGWPGVEVQEIVRTFEKPRTMWEGFRAQFEDPSLATRDLYRTLSRQNARAAGFMTRYRASLPPDYLDTGWVREMGQIRSPTAVIWGDHDRIMPFEFADRVTRSIPGARLRVIEGTRHFPFFERPDEFARIVSDFAASRPGA